ncbi:MAG TPA: argininosuccinate lyase, partial [Longimicrobiales bacterium]|nr:argininosuccinate lyase [Longimicrobiales bacterium]
MSEGASTGSPHRLWGGRYAEGPAPTLDELNRSLPVDRRLWAEDVEGSRAWARALVEAGVLTDEQGTRLDEGLLRVHERLAAGAADAAADEDIHTLVERLLYEEVGEVAGTLHTGRSRNDQVATDTRLWALRAAARLDEELRALQGALVAQAEQTVELVMPAYTHVRRAQPVRVAHWALSHFWALERDRQRLGDALARVSVLPLGSGAVTGCAYPVDRHLLQELLGFAALSPNSLDAVGDRDWVCELVFVAALAGAHLSRLAEDLILFSSAEFAFVELPEAYTTGSSLLPQKRNPDGLELARGRAARLLGDVTASLALLKGLPTGYQKDLQEDKTLLFDAFDQLVTVLPATRETVAGLRWHGDALRAAVSDDALLAVDVADALVRRGLPFREAHGVVGRLLRAADAQGTSLGGLPDAVWRGAHPALEEGPLPEVSVEAALEARSVVGGTARGAVLAQLEQARLRLAPRAGADATPN